MLAEYEPAVLPLNYSGTVEYLAPCWGHPDRNCLIHRHRSTRAGGNRTHHISVMSGTFSPLNYGPIPIVCIDHEHSPVSAWAQMESNHRLHAYQACVLPLDYEPH
jgi:hypothetical protein